ncbi:MAG: ribonuclease Z [Bacteroides sp.]|nr:ribonuclease Z [Bacteroides sp.]MCM1413013.1 ribonuclease Z [Bacteroides sp.]MCM1471719.1 ribonuclease Z [Bacteroides sp.]
MDRFEVNILGCGSASPTPLHNPASQVVNFRDNLFMIDCGEGAQRMMRRMSLKFSRLNHIFISHMHGDHCLGLPGLLSTLGLHERTGRVVIHLPSDGLAVMKGVTDYFCRQSPFDIVYEPITGKGGRLFESPSLTVDAFPLYHRIPAYGFLFRETPKPRHLRGDMVKFHQIPVRLLRDIKEGADYVTPDGRTIPNQALTTPADPSRSYAYCSDTMYDQRVVEAVRGVDVLYHEATYLSDVGVLARERGHSTALDAATVAREAGVGRLVIGHYSKRYTDYEVLVEEARGVFEAVVGANEGMVIKI